MDIITTARGHVVILNREGIERSAGALYDERSIIMSFTPIFMKSGSKGARYTNLFACISEEEEDSYTVQVRLYSQAAPESTAWGEEVANSLEVASMLVTALAAEFSIAREQIKIEIRMRDPKSGTRH